MGDSSEHWDEETWEKMIDHYIQEQNTDRNLGSTMQRKLANGYLFAAYNTVKVKDIHGFEHHQISTLDSFEHACKLYVDFGLGLFAFVNAGIYITGLNAMAILIPLSLLVGKFLGILLFYKVAFRCGFRPPLGIHTKHICMIGIIASIGLVVAIFVSDVAFTDTNLKGDAKLGAILSAVPCPIICLVLSKVITFDSANEDKRTTARDEIKKGGLEQMRTGSTPSLTGQPSPKSSPKAAAKTPVDIEMANKEKEKETV